MTSSWPRSVAILAALVILAASANPVRRSTDLEARRRSAIDRNMIRFGRSYPAEPSAADIREAFQRTARRGNSFLRLGRSQQPLSFTTDDLISILRAYDDEAAPDKRATNFIRLGRDPSFIRFGRSADDEKEQSADLVVSGFPQRKGRARDHFVRLGRDSEEVVEDQEERKKRSVCLDCQS